MDDRIHEPAIDIEAIRWERITLVIEGRVADGAAGDGRAARDSASLRFVHAERDGELPPTHLDGGASDRVIDELILGGRA